MSMDIGGAETHIMELCRELHSRGHDVTLASGGGVYADRLVKAGIRHVSLPLYRKDPSSVIKSYSGLKKLISDEKYDIVHAHARIPAFICGLIWDTWTDSDGRRFRFVTTTHLDFAVNALWRRISRWGEHSMAVSSDIAEYLVREYDYPEDRIHLTVNGIDTERFSENTDFSPVLEKHSLRRERRRIVYMSRLDADRAEPAYRLIEAAPEIHGKHPDCDIIIVGGGTCEDELRGLAEKVNTDAGINFITMTGAVSNTHEYCAAADIFIGVSRSALEAMAASKPVIVAGGQGALGIFDSTKEDEAVRTNFCCRGCPAETTVELIRDIDTLLEKDSGELRQAGAYNRSVVERNYTSSRMADDYLAMYEDAVKSPVSFRGKPDAVISGYYGFGNLGDESLLDIITQTLAVQKPGIKLAVLTRNPKNEARRTGLKCVSRFNPFAVLSVIARSETLISGGGSLLQDATSRRSLRYYAGIIDIAERLHKRVCILANGIGPVSDEKNRRLTADVMSRADYISVRDSRSKEELVKLGIDAERVNVTADPAFLIKPAEKAKTDMILTGLGLAEKRYFAVSLRPSAHLKADSVTDDEIVKSLADAVKNISETYNMVPLVIPMQKIQDTGICMKLAGCLPDSVLYSPSGAGELIGVLEGAALVIGMRLHSVIFASSIGTPVIGLSYDPKVRSFMQSLGQDTVCGLTALDTSVLSCAAEIMENEKSTREKIKKSASAMREAAWGDIGNI